MTKRNDDPEPEHDLKPEPQEKQEKTLRAPRLEVTPLEGETTRVMLTDDNRVVLTERYIPTADFGFRIFVDGQHYEQIGVVPDSGARVYAPTR